MLMHAGDSWTPKTAMHRIAEAASSGITVAGLLKILRRERTLILATTVLIVGLGLAFALTARPLYSATANVIIDSRNARVMENSNAGVTATQLGLDSAAVDSQLEIIKSEEIALRVIREWKLADRPDFTTANSAIIAWLDIGLRSFRRLLSFSPEAPSVETDGIPRAVVDEFAKRLIVKRVEETYVIGIRFDAEERGLAAGIANSIANAYLDEQLRARFDSVSRASKWLEARIEELRGSAIKADRAVQEYRRANDIYLTGPGAATGNSADTQAQSLTDQRLAKATEDYANTQRMLLEKQARYDQILGAIKTNNPDASVVESLNSDVISRIRTQLSTNAAREAEWERRYGSRHEAVLRLKYEDAQLRASMMAELERVAQVYKNDLDVVRMQESNLKGVVSDMKSAAYADSVAQVTLRDLQRDADTYRNLYQSFLERYQSATQQQTFPITDARILTRASEPRDKSSPKTTLILILSTVGGLMFGCGLALAKNYADSAFRTPSDVEQYLGLTCLGVLPRVARHRKKSSPPGPRMLAADLGILEYGAAEPLSRFSETLRSVKVAADLSFDDKGQIIGIVSSIPGEGKSTLAMNLAQLIALSGSGVLVIDADLRNPSLSRSVSPERAAGLLDCLMDSKPLDQVVCGHPSRPLNFLPAYGARKVTQTSELLGSSRMRDLLATASRHYDYVIIDLPPLAPVVDVRAIAPMIGAFVYIIEWGKTSVATVKQAMQTVQGMEEKMLGCVLNKANMEALRLYSQGVATNEYYDYERFRPYVTSH